MFSFFLGGLDFFEGLFDYQTQRNQLGIQDQNIKMQESAAQAQASQVAIKQDEKLQSILSAENFTAANQGTTLASFSALTMKNLNEFSKDRENLNANLKMNENILNIDRKQVKSQRKMLPYSELLNFASGQIRSEAVRPGSSLFSDLFGS